MDLFYSPLYIPREFYYIVFNMRMERYKEEKRKKDEEEKTAKEEQRREEEMKRNKRLNSKVFSKRLSPAAQARELKHNSQVDENDGKEATEVKKPISPPSGLNIEDLVDVLEEGG